MDLSKNLENAVSKLIGQYLFEFDLFKRGLLNTIIIAYIQFNGK